MKKKIVWVLSLILVVVASVLILFTNSKRIINKQEVMLKKAVKAVCEYYKNVSTLTKLSDDSVKEVTENLAGYVAYYIHENGISDDTKNTLVRELGNKVDIYYYDNEITSFEDTKFDLNTSNLEKLIKDGSFADSNDNFYASHKVNDSD